MACPYEHDDCPDDGFDDCDDEVFFDLGHPENDAQCCPDESMLSKITALRELRHTFALAVASAFCDTVEQRRRQPRAANQAMIDFCARLTKAINHDRSGMDEVIGMIAGLNAEARERGDTEFIASREADVLMTHHLYLGLILTAVAAMPEYDLQVSFKVGHRQAATG